MSKEIKVLTSFSVSAKPTQPNHVVNKAYIDDIIKTIRESVTDLEDSLNEHTINEDTNAQHLKIIDEKYILPNNATINIDDMFIDKILIKDYIKSTIEDLVGDIGDVIDELNGVNIS